MTRVKLVLGGMCPIGLCLLHGVIAAGTKEQQPARQEPADPERSVVDVVTLENRWRGIL